MPAGLQFLRSNVPNCPELSDLVDYFDTTYVTLRDRLGGSSALKCLQHLRTAMLWPLCACVASRRPLRQTSGTSTTPRGVDTRRQDQQRVRENWNDGFRQLVDHSHPGVWTTIQSLQLNKALWCHITRVDICFFSPFFPTPVYLAPPMKGFPLEFGIDARGHESLNNGATRWSKKFKIGLVVLIQYRL